MTECDYSPDALALHAAPFYGWDDRWRCPLLDPAWLPVDPTNRNAVRGIEPATGPSDSELAVMANLHICPYLEEPSLLTLLKKIYQHYDVPFSESPLLSSTARERICVAGKAGIVRICEACYRLGANIDVDRLVRQTLTDEIGNLNARCQRLEYLFRTGRACPRNQARVEKLLESIKMSSALKNIELLRDRDSFSDLYFKFSATIRNLRKLVKDELDLANCRVEEFDALRKHYEDGGRRDLVILMQENAKAARKAGFEEGVASAEDSQQVYDELEKIDEGLAKIGEILKESKEFWEGVDRKLSPTPGSQQTENPPDGITTGPEELRIERRAEEIHAGLQTVHSAAQPCSKSKKIRKAGDKIVGDAATLIKNCTDVVQTQTSAEIHLHNPVCDRKSGRKALSPLKKGLGQLVTGYEKLSLRFMKYTEMIYLLVWFAGSAATDRLLMDKPEYVQVAQAELISKGLFTSSYSSHALPFEMAFSRLDRQLHEMRKVWSELVVRVDGLGTQELS
ncbi:hypothetical protein B0H13DRAFT_2561617 [Mycena leptocephala]|nr:hypothetical protein B0H13DRAFT_2561617 [Mycena leptocephala]